MSPLRIKDNSQEAKGVFSDIGELVGKISDKTLGKLEDEGVFVFPEKVDDAEDLSREQMILKTVDGSYRSGNVMGFVGCGDERLVVESRFCEGGSDFFLQYLVSKVFDFPNFVDLQTDADQDDRIFGYLFFLFPYYLKRATRKGLYKKYVTKERNDENVRGAIDVARHIAKNTPFVGRVAYVQREFSYDNELTNLVRHTIEFIRRKPYGSRILAKAKDEVRLIVDATPGYKAQDRQKVIIGNRKNVVRHAFYREYRDLQRLCLLILGHQKHRIGTGSNQMYGVLFDGAWLWEEYVNTLIGSGFYHPQNKKREGAQYLFDGEGGKAGRIYPDFIGKDEVERIIADAKYKPTENIGGKDYLQMLAYMFRFEAKTGYYLYPKSGEGEDSRLWLMRGSAYEGKASVEKRDDVSVIKCGLAIPHNAIDYDSFVAEMKKSEAEFVSSILITT